MEFRLFLLPVELVYKMAEEQQLEKGMNPFPGQRSLAYPDASLEQNFPNPYNQATTIRYTLPQSFGSAKIVIASTSGMIVRQLPLAGAGAGQVKVEAGSLKAGMYLYSLMVDGTLIDTKKMAVTK